MGKWQATNIPRSTYTALAMCPIKNPRFIDVFRVYVDDVLLLSEYYLFIGELFLGLKFNSTFVFGKCETHGRNQFYVGTVQFNGTIQMFHNNV